MANKLDCTEKAYEIMMKHTNWRKPKRMTPKRQKAIDASWKKWKIYRQALLDAGLYGGMAQSLVLANSEKVHHFQTKRPKTIKNTKNTKEELQQNDDP